MFNKIKKSIRRLNHQRIDWMRECILRIVQFLFDGAHHILSAEQAQDKPVLVFRLDDKLGDSVTATGFLRELKIGVQPRQVWVVCSESAAGFYSKLSYVDQVIKVKKGLFNTLKLYWQLRDQAFYAMINTSHIIRSRTLFWFSCLSAQHKISMRGFGYLSFTAHADYDACHAMVTERYVSVLSLLSIYPDRLLTYDFPLDEKARLFAHAEVSQLRARGYQTIISLNSFAGARMRSFSQQTTLKIVEMLTAHAHVAVVSLASAQDMSELKRWHALAKNHSWFVFSEKTDLQSNAGILNEADLLVTPDTAWVHLASALKKPILAVYREDLPGCAENNSRTWGPFGVQAQIIFSPYDQTDDPDINLFSYEDFKKAYEQLRGSV